MVSEAASPYTSIIQVPPIEAMWQPSLTLPPISARSTSRAAIPYWIALSVLPIWVAMIASMHEDSDDRQWLADHRIRNSAFCFR